MRYHALACDYDGTIAKDGKVAPPTLEALKRLKESGRKLILVTGRVLPELLDIMPDIGLFDRVVAEDGALLYRPDTRAEKVLAEKPPKKFVAELRKRGVDPLIVGRCIVATFRPHETAVFETIRDLNLEFQVIFNKNAVMVLPSGVNKAFGLNAALGELRLSPHNVAGIGDAENDHAFLTRCECAAAVANGLQATKEAADYVTTADHGFGAVEFIDMLISSDLSLLEPKLRRHEILIGRRENREEVRVPPYGTSVMVAGASGGGKSTFATSFVERLAEMNYQFCVIDPEGDYPELVDAVVLGSPHHSPDAEEAIKLIERRENCVVNLVGIRLDDRPAFFEGLLHQILDLRSRTGRPHWIIMDETHHLLPTAWGASTFLDRKNTNGMMFITVHPERVAKGIVESVDVLFAIGDKPGMTIESFSDAIRTHPPPVPQKKAGNAEVVAWWRRPERMPFLFQPFPPAAERRRHIRKYAEGELPPDRSFYFRGPEGKLKLRAQNLNIFMQIGDGVDDATWLYHLYQRDYSKWMKEMIKDKNLAEEVQGVERRKDVDAEEGRALIREIIEKRYGGPE